MNNPPAPHVLFCILALGANQFATAQCVWDWKDAPGISGGTPTIYAMTTWDPDGSGPAPELLVVAGEFLAAGAVPANNIAAWDGQSWQSLGAGLDAPAYALAVLPTGELVAGGTFTHSGATSVPCIASWNGSAWSGMGAGMNNAVNGLCVDASGALIAGGFFTSAGSVAVNRVARWSNGAWAPMGSGANNVVYALAAAANGDVWMGGAFTASGAVLRTRIARWNGSSWLAAGSMNSVVMGLAALPTGEIAATGNFTTAGAAAVHYAATSSGNGMWSPLGGTGMNMPGRALYVREEGSVLIGGFFTFAGATPANRIAQWSGTEWLPLGDGIDAVVLAMCEYNGEIYAGGAFTTAGSIPSLCFARYSPVPTLSITQQPSGGHACVPGTFSLQVQVQAAGSVSYQWRHNSQVIEISSNPTARSPTLELQVQSPADLGEFDCVVSDSCTILASAPAALDTCPADFNCDGGVDGGDVESFFAFWQEGQPPADVNQDGGIDGADVEAFFHSWEAGGC